MRGNLTRWHSARRPGSSANRLQNPPSPNNAAPDARGWLRAARTPNSSWPYPRLAVSQQSWGNAKGDAAVADRLVPELTADGSLEAIAIPHRNPLRDRADLQKGLFAAGDCGGKTVPHNDEALMDFSLVILPPFASQRAGDLFWPAADLLRNQLPSNRERLCCAYAWRSASYQAPWPFCMDRPRVASRK